LFRARWLATSGLENVVVGGNWPEAPNNSTIDGPSVGVEVGYVGV
jgi:hypothetical protein